VPWVPKLLTSHPLTGSGLASNRERGDVAFLLQLLVEGLHRPLLRPGLGQFIAKQADCVFVRRRAANVKARKRIHDKRSPIMNSITRASDRLCCACRISALSIDTGSNGGRPSLAPSL